MSRNAWYNVNVVRRWE